MDLLIFEDGLHPLGRSERLDASRCRLDGYRPKRIGAVCQPSSLEMVEDVVDFVQRWPGRVTHGVDPLLPFGAGLAPARCPFDAGRTEQYDRMHLFFGSKVSQPSGKLIADLVLLGPTLLRCHITPVGIQPRALKASTGRIRPCPHRLSGRYRSPSGCSAVSFKA